MLELAINTALQRFWQARGKDKEFLAVPNKASYCACGLALVSRRLLVGACQLDNKVSWQPGFINRATPWTTQSGLIYVSTDKKRSFNSRS